MKLFIASFIIPIFLSYLIVATAGLRCYQCDNTDGEVANCTNSTKGFEPTDCGKVGIVEAEADACGVWIDSHGKLEKQNCEVNETLLSSLKFLKDSTTGGRRCFEDANFTTATGHPVTGDSASTIYSEICICGGDGCNKRTKSACGPQTFLSAFFICISFITQHINSLLIEC